MPQLIDHDKNWVWLLEIGECTFAEFLKNIVKVDVTDQQMEIVRAVDAGKLRLACKSGHGTGKSFLFANLAVWFMCKYDDAIVAVTGVAFKQLQKTFYKEVILAFERLPEALQEKFNIKAESIERIKKIRGKEVPATSYLAIRTAAEGDTTALQGFHSDHLMVLVDEASGVSQGTFNALRGALTSIGSIFGMIGNPEMLSGAFYDAFHSKAHLWDRFTFSGEDSPRVSQESIDDYIAEWGKDHDQYRIRVMGEFPRSEDGSLIELEVIMSRVDLDLGDRFGNIVRFGVDVGEQGPDPSVIAKIRGHTLYEFKKWNQTRAPDLERYVKIENDIDKPKSIKIDNIGVGSGVAAHLEDDLPGIAIGIRNSERAKDEFKFNNVRAELFWELRERFYSGEISIINDPELIADLASLRYTIRTGKIFILPKKDMKKELGRSPDKADALALAFYEEECQVLA